MREERDDDGHNINYQAGLEIALHSPTAKSTEGDLKQRLL